MSGETKGKKCKFQKRVSGIYFRNYASFYKHLCEQVSSAEISIALTHVRPEPPSEFPLAKEYFNNIVEWVKKHPYGSVRRITTIMNEKMYVWAKDLLELSKGLPNFDVRVIGWNVDSPAMNMAIIDSTHVYVVIPSTVPEGNTAIYVKDRNICEAFSKYYELLWSNCTPLEDWFARNSERFKNEKERVTRPLLPISSRNG